MDKDDYIGTLCASFIFTFFFMIMGFIVGVSEYTLEGKIVSTILLGLSLCFMLYFLSLKLFLQGIHVHSNKKSFNLVHEHWPQHLWTQFFPKGDKD